MSGSTLDYIILAIIFVIAIYLFLNTIKSTKCSRNEHMDNVSNPLGTIVKILPDSLINFGVKNFIDNSIDQSSLQNEEEPSLQYEEELSLQYEEEPSLQNEEEPSLQYEEQPSFQYEEQPSFQYEEQPSFQYEEQPSLQNEEEQLPMIKSVVELPNLISDMNQLSSEYAQEAVNTRKQVCMLDNVDITNDRYIREYVLGGKYTCFNKTDFKPEEVQDYQDNFFKFNENINYNSNGGVNTVDKLNELNNNVNDYYGMKMSDVYNELTGVCMDKKNKCVNENCLIPPKLDAQFKGGYYMDETPVGKFMKKYNFRYEDDDVLNGGKFYDDIEASDNEFESNMAL
jgi:hypothetical protein